MSFEILRPSRTAVGASFLLLALSGVLPCHPAPTQTVPPVSDKVTIRETVTEGFVHPGIGLTRPILENARSMVLAGKEPWLSGYRALALAGPSARDAKAGNRNPSNPSLPQSDAFVDDNRMKGMFRGDAMKAYNQALMYYFTGDPVYRDNALAILRLWSKIDPSKFKYNGDAHIHTGYELRAMTTAAELLRSIVDEGGASCWTAEDTEAFSKNLVRPAILNFMNSNGWFMNQNDYALLGAMAGFIFMDDREGYNSRVEWFTVNSTAPNPGRSGSIKHLARLVDTDAQTGEKVPVPAVQLVELGRDLAHGGDDTGLFVDIANMMLAQGTKVDPQAGVVSTRPDAVGPYEFLNDRILAAVDFYCRYNIGYDTPWIPTPFDMTPDGKVNRIYPRLSDQYRGRIGVEELGCIWYLYYYYKYIRGVDVAKAAPYFYEAFTKRMPDSVTGRVPDQHWLYIPAAAEKEGASLLVPATAPGVVAVARRHTALTEGISTLDEGGTAFVRILPTPEGRKLAILNTATESKILSLRIRTTQAASISIQRLAKPWILPDTQDRWRYVSYTLGNSENLDNYGQILFLRVQGEPGGHVDLDQLLLKPDAEAIAPAFALDGPESSRICEAGARVTIDFGVRDPGAPVAYSASRLPSGAALDAQSGLFSWGTPREGAYTFVVQAERGGTMAAKRVSLFVAASRNAAISKATEKAEPASSVAATRAAYEDALQQANEAAAGAASEAFHSKLFRLQDAVAALEPLTPRLSDGSLDFSRCVTSPQILPVGLSRLTDGNSDTFPWNERPSDGSFYVFDFGPGFRFSAEALGLQGRLNFEERGADVLFFGSNDGTSWTRLTTTPTPFSTSLIREEVSPEQKSTRFRYLKVQRRGGFMELSEVRIYGERFEAAPSAG